MDDENADDEMIQLEKDHRGINAEFPVKKHKHKL